MFHKIHFNIISNLVPKRYHRKVKKTCSSEKTKNFNSFNQSV